MNDFKLRLAIRNILQEAMLNEEFVTDPDKPLPFNMMMDQTGEYVGPSLPPGYGTVLADEEQAKKPAKERKLKQKAATNWEEYVKLTAIQYKDAEVNGNSIDEGYINNFVNEYKKIVSLFTVTKNNLKREDGSDNPIFEEAYRLMQEQIQFLDDMTDDYQSFQKWYMKFNESDMGQAIRESDPMTPGAKYMSAPALMAVIKELIPLVGQVFAEGGNPTPEVEIPPQVKEMPEEQQKVAVEKAKKKLGQKIKDGFSKAVSGLKAQKPEPAVPEEGSEDAEKQKATGLNPNDENYAWTLPKDGIPKDHPAFKAMDSNGDGKIGQNDITKWTMGGMDKYLASVGQKKFRSPEDEA